MFLPAHLTSKRRQRVRLGQVGFHPGWHLAGADLGGETFRYLAHPQTRPRFLQLAAGRVVRHWSFTGLPLVYHWSATGSLAVSGLLLGRHWATLDGPFTASGPQPPIIFKQQRIILTPLGGRKTTVQFEGGKRGRRRM